MKNLTLTPIAYCLLGGSLLLNGCSDSSNYDFAQGLIDDQALFEKKNVVAVFDPAGGKIPPTNNLLFAGSTDGTLNIPPLPTDSAGATALKSALNTLDGFSTVNPITTEFGAPLDASSIVAGSSVRLFEIGADAENNSAVIGEFKSLSGAAVGADGSTMALIPTSPLKGSTNYVVIITNQVKTSDGFPVVADRAYKASKGTASLEGSSLEALDPIRKITNANEAFAASQGIKSSDIVLSWSFRTQSIGATLQQVFDNSEAGTFVTLPALLRDPDTGDLLIDAETNQPIQSTTKDALMALNPDGNTDGIVGAANMFIGALTVPYFLNQGSAALTGTFETANNTPPTSLDPTPLKKSDLTIPVLISVPNADSTGGGEAPDEGFPVVIFQHGITANRTSLVPIANALANAGFVGVAIDLALHGVPVEFPIHASNTPFDDTEQTFGIDLVNNETLAPGSDSIADPSGTHFINLVSVPTSRGNFRQSVSNLFVLRKSLASIASASADFPGIPLDGNTIRYVGHSLGGIVGTTYLAFDDTVGAATLAMPGGGIAELLNNSVRFGPRIEAGLAANGINKGTPEFASFIGATQWIIDSVDPINHAAKAGEKHPIHRIEVVGIEGNAGSSDQVIPNSVATAPLSGTESLARVMGLSQVSSPGANGGGLVKFTAGDHSSILIPSAADTLDVTIEMQTQTATFMVTNGASLPVANADVTQ